jgi:hypothetical protein
MTPVPWSANFEKWIRRLILFEWITVWVAIIFFVGMMAQKMLWPALFGLLLIVLFGADLIYHQDKLEEMLSNKPRSTAELTMWVQLRDWQTEMNCACGAQVHFSTAKWYANSVDAGGGRFSLVCPCGIGYFKLKP